MGAVLGPRFVYIARVASIEAIIHRAEITAMYNSFCLILESSERRISCLGRDARRHINGSVKKEKQINL